MNPEVKVYELEEVPVDKKSKPTILKNLSYYFTEYCEHTTIHGFKFLGERGRFFIERIFWIILLCTSFTICAYLITKTYMKWTTSPVIVTFATTQTPLWKIPFPAVTICPEIKSQKNQYNFTLNLLKKRNGTLTDEENVEFEYMSSVCEVPSMIFAAESSLMETSNDTVLDFLQRVAPDFHSIVETCSWKEEDCSTYINNYFTPTLTSEGICYTFNMLNREEIYTSITTHYHNFSFHDRKSSEWTVDKGYSKDSTLDAFPRRTVLAESDSGLVITLKTKVHDLDYVCGDSIQGYKVILHHPAEVPRGKQRYFRVPLDQDVVAAVKPNMMTTSAELRRYGPEDRQCYFIEEKTLRFFQVYNQQNCVLECLTNFTKHHCGCVAFYMPRDDSTPICGLGNKRCMDYAKVEFLEKEVKFKISHPDVGQKLKINKKTISSECNCLPSCNSLEFDAETSQAHWDWVKSLTVLGENELDEDSSLSDIFHYSRLRIFFKEMQFMTSERNQLYGYTDFWANCGGLLGLFTGFSFISLLEFIYFATLRFVCNWKLYGKGYWSGAQKLLILRDQK